MGQKLVIGPIDRGLRTDRTAFAIDNDSFPTLDNAFQWRGRVKRKRGTAFVNRLNRQLTLTITLDGTGSFNLLAGLESGSSIVLGSLTLTVGPGSPFTDTTKDGFLVPKGTTPNFNTINYSTGVIRLPLHAGEVYTAVFSYYPNLPVMGIEDLILNTTDFPGTVALDTKYAYRVSTAQPYPVTDITFYSNPASLTYPNYTAKGTPTPFTWNGKDYQQFGSVNYLSGLFVTNGVQVPFDVGNVGMQFKPISGVSIVTAGNGTTIPAVATITITGHGLVVGDFIFINEIIGITGINFQTGYVTAVVDVNNVTVTFPTAILAGAWISGGIAQYLTKTAVPGKDCIRFFDGQGWVNFMPPLSQGTFSINDERELRYYLVGAKIVYQFASSLLFFGPVIQTSSGNPIYLPATVVFCLQEATPYYTCSFNSVIPDDPTNAINVTPILAPDDETAFPATWFEDQTGHGGSVSAPLSQSIATVAPNSNALIVGFNPSTQTRLHNTGNNLNPFEFFLVNSELGSSSTFSSITMDEGVITRGPKGFLMSSQTETRRIDLDILQQPFDINNANNGTERFTSQRDFQNEWVYFSYVNKDFTAFNSQYPNQTLQFNYRDNSWAIFDESYTTYGSFRRTQGYTWETLTEKWGNITTNWEDLNSEVLDPDVVGGNQQGYIVFRASNEAGTQESVSLFIQNIVGRTVTSPNHGLNSQDFIQIVGCLGTIAPYVNGRVFQIGIVDSNTFRIIVDFIPDTATYVGGGQIVRYYVPFFQTKQFPLAWSDSRKVRFGPQMHLLTRTNNAQITLLMYLSQDNAFAYNADPNDINNLIYSTVLYTCLESTNLGLTPANTNLQMPNNAGQQQIWHRLNTSLLGDTVQLGYKISDEQMLTYSQSGQSFNVTGITKANPCVVTCNSTIPTGSLVQLQGVGGMVQLNTDTYTTIDTTNATQVTLNLDSSSFPPYTSGGTIFVVAPVFQTAEVELHSIILDVYPSGMLA